jgi:integrase
VLYSGLRLGETLALRWADVDLEARRVIVRRNRVLVGGRMVEGSPKRERSARTIALLGGAVEALRRQRALQAAARLAAGDAWRDEDRVFSTGTGHGLDGGNVERAGVRRLPLHSLRHATASILLAAGVSVAVAAKMLGHSVTLFCETYADLLVEATHDAARQADEWLARQAPSPRVSGGAAAGAAEPLLIGRRDAGRRR